MDKGMNATIMALMEQFSSLRDALEGIGEVAANRKANGLVFACHMLIESFAVYETEVVRFIASLDEDEDEEDE